MTRRLRAARNAERGAERATLSPGYTVLQGTVECDGTDPPVRLVLRQTGIQYRRRGGMRHVWREYERSLLVRPFHLALAGGARVKVEPDPSVLFAAPLAVGEVAPAEPERVRKPDAHSAWLRTKTAELSRGTSAFVSGELAEPSRLEAYRSAEEGFTLRAPPGRRMVVSLAPLGDHLARTVSVHRLWALLLACAFLLTNTVMLGSYWVKTVFGRAVEATAVTVSELESSSLSSRCLVEAEAVVEGRKHLLDAQLQFCTGLEMRRRHGESVKMPFFVVPGSADDYNVGSRPTLYGWFAFTSWVVLGLCALGYWLHAKSARPWYERGPLLESGTGLLG
jgi:hypothetical protein